MKATGFSLDLNWKVELKFEWMKWWAGRTLSRAREWVKRNIAMETTHTHTHTQISQSNHLPLNENMSKTEPFGCNTEERTGHSYPTIHRIQAHPYTISECVDDVVVFCFSAKDPNISGKVFLFQKNGWVHTQHAHLHRQRGRDTQHRRYVSLI